MSDIDRLAKTGQLRTRATAHRTAEKIRASGPAGTQNEAFSKRPTELERENEALRDRIEEVEAKGKPPAGNAVSIK